MLRFGSFASHAARLGWNAEPTATAVDCAPESLTRVVLVADAQAAGMVHCKQILLLWCSR